MTDYLLRLVIMLPLVAGLAWASLWAWKRLQLGLPMQQARERPARIVDVLPLGGGGKLAVVRFDGRDLLVAVTRGQVSLLNQSRGDYLDG